MTDFEDEFLSVLNSEDDLGAVVRGHIHIESHLNTLIESCLPNPTYVKKLDLEYHQKVDLAVACGLEGRLARPLRALGTLRNKFAHNLDAKLGKKEADCLYNSFDGEDKQLIQSAFQRTNKQSKEKMPKSLTKMEPKDQFILIAISLRAALLLEIERLISR